MKKKTIACIGVAALLGACGREEIPLPATENEGTVVEMEGNQAVLQGCIRVKLRYEPEGEVKVRSVGGNVTTGIRALDRSASVLKVSRMERTFPYAGKYEERTRREGLHLWYNVWFEKDTPASRAATQVALLDDIELAVPIPKVVSTAATGPGSTWIARAEGWGFDDADLPRQWYLNNPGTETWQQAGADIRLGEVWKTYNGHPSIVVSVVDGGIATAHPDLQPNLWVNPGEVPDNGLDDDGNGYVDDVHGYNFVDGNANLVPHRHGTHVAGLVGAASNNGTGMAGVAGGDGTPNSGVKLMSCQILKHGALGLDDLATDIGAAIKYGADNGAVISQNSWGYAADRGARTTAASYIDPAHKAAIDYFIKYAGCDNDGHQLPDSPMKGGIVLFASGNANSPSPRVAAPADYEPVVAVAAIEADYRKASYSNYGDYMDIAAPGGALSGNVQRIWSTTIPAWGDYEYRSGTSMACPLVSGVAALLIEKYGVGRKGFTPDRLKEMLYASAYDLDVYNPTYAGQLGHGGVDATAALNVDLSKLQPLMLKTKQVTDNALTFSVSGALAGEGMLTLYNNVGAKVAEARMTLSPLVWRTVDVTRLAAGYYLLVYECNGQRVEENWIKY